MHCAFKLRVLGLMAYWYTGSAFHQIPQSYLNDVHLVPSVVPRDNELLTKVLMDIDTWKMQEGNILTAWQTPVSIRALIGWLQVWGCRFKSWIFSSFTYFSNMLCAVKLRVLGLMAYWYTGSDFHQIPQSYLNLIKFVRCCMWKHFWHISSQSQRHNTLISCFSSKSAL